MEMKLLREEIPIERWTAGGQSEAIVEGSVALEGGLRQVVRVLYAGADVVIRQAEPRQDSLHIRGQVQFRALYAQEGTAEARAVEASADFDHDMSLTGCTQRCTAQVQASARTVEASVYGGRMNLRAVLDLQALCMLKTQVNAVTGFADTENLELQTQQLTIRRTAAQGDAEDTIREEFELDAALADTHTLFATAQARVDEVSGGEGRATVSGEVLLNVWHAGAALPLTMTRHTIPFEQCVQLCGQRGEELQATVNVLDAAVASQAAGDTERLLRAEIQLHTDVQAVTDDHLTLLSDAYTTTGDTIALTRDTISFRTADRAAAADETARVMLLMPEAPSMRQILAAFATPEITQIQPANNRTQAEGTLHVTLIGLSREDNSLVSIEADTPFRQYFNAECRPDDAIAITAADAEARLITSDRAELRCTLRLHITGVETATAALVTDASTPPAQEPNGSIILYFVQPGDSLWSIAKHYRVSCASIRAINPEMTDSVTTGQGIVVWHRTYQDTKLTH